MAERARDLAEILEAKGFVPAGFAPGKGAAVVAGLLGGIPQNPAQNLVGGIARQFIDENVAPRPFIG